MVLQKGVTMIPQSYKRISYYTAFTMIIWYCYIASWHTNDDDGEAANQGVPHVRHLEQRQRPDSPGKNSSPRLYLVHLPLRITEYIAIYKMAKMKKVHVLHFRSVRSLIGVYAIIHVELYQGLQRVCSRYVKQSTRSFFRVVDVFLLTALHCAQWGLSRWRQHTFQLTWFCMRCFWCRSSWPRCSRCRSRTWIGGSIRRQPSNPAGQYLSLQSV